MTKVEQIKAFAEGVGDPVFKQSLLLIAEALELAGQFKRIDMAFLQIRGDSNIPKFALLPYDKFKDGTGFCNLSTAGYEFQLPNGGILYRFTEMVSKESFPMSTANPKSIVPESVAAEVESVREKFDEVLVAWEADWQPRKGDPIVIGRRGAYYYIIAVWDLTKLESFVTDTFAS